MILDSLENYDRYRHLHPLFLQAIQFLRITDLKKLPAGRHEIDGDRLFALVSEGPGKEKENALLEVHRKYIDIQHIVSGTDVMGWKPLKQCSEVQMEYNDDKDAALFKEDPLTWFDVPAGNFTIFFPEDAHAPLATTEVVKKVVVKILM